MKHAVQGLANETLTFNRAAPMRSRTVAGQSFLADGVAVRGPTILLSYVSRRTSGGRGEPYGYGYQHGTSRHVETHRPPRPRRSRPHGVSTTASASTREVVRYTSEVQPGTIVVKTAERKLYLVLGDGTAIRYAVAVGRPGKQWQGKARVSGKYVQPAWTPPVEVRRITRCCRR